MVRWLWVPQLCSLVPMWLWLSPSLLLGSLQLLFYALIPSITITELLGILNSPWNSSWDKKCGQLVLSLSVPWLAFCDQAPPWVLIP